MRYFKVLLFILLFCAEVSAQNNEIKVGVLTDVSGVGAYWGNQTIVGARLAQEEINKNNSLKIDIVYGDSRLDTKTGVTETQKMLFIDKVDAMYAEFTPVVSAISPLIQNKKKLLVYEAAAVSPVKNNEYSFKSYLSYSDGCILIAQKFKELGLKNVGILKSTSEYGQLCEDGVKKVFLNPYVLEYNFGDDVSTQILQMKNKGIEGIFNVLFEEDAIRMFKSIKSLQYDVYIGGNVDSYTKKVTSSYPDLAKKTYTFGFSNINQDFKNKVIKFDPDNNLVTLEATALAYIHLKQIYSSFKVCGKEDVDCQIKEMSKFKSDNIIGFKSWQNRIAQFDLTLRQAG